MSVVTEPLAELTAKAILSVATTDPATALKDEAPSRLLAALLDRAAAVKEREAILANKIATERTERGGPWPAELALAHFIDGDGDGGGAADTAAGTTTVFELLVVRCNNLKDADWFGESDPFVAVRVGPVGSKWADKPAGGVHEARTRTVENTSNPEFAASLAVAHEGGGGGCGGGCDLEIQLAVFDKDCLGDEFLGTVRIPVAATGAAAAQTETRAAEPTAGGGGGELRREPSGVVGLGFVDIAAAERARSGGAAHNVGALRLRAAHTFPLRARDGTAELDHIADPPSITLSYSRRSGPRVAQLVAMLARACDEKTTKVAGLDPISWIIYGKLCNMDGDATQMDATADLGAAGARSAADRLVEKATEGLRDEYPARLDDAEKYPTRPLKKNESVGFWLPDLSEEHPDEPMLRLLLPLFLGIVAWMRDERLPFYDEDGTERIPKMFESRQEAALYFALFIAPHMPRVEDIAYLNEAIHVRGEVGSICFAGVGQWRLKAVTWPEGGTVGGGGGGDGGGGGGGGPTWPDREASAACPAPPRTAVAVVDVSALAQYGVRKGYVRYGACVFFDATREPIAAWIESDKTYLLKPGDGASEADRDAWEVEILQNTVSDRGCGRSAQSGDLEALLFFPSCCSLSVLRIDVVHSSHLKI